MRYKGETMSEDFLEFIEGLAPTRFTPDPSLLLHPQIPMPLAGMAPKDLMGDKWWKAEKQKAYQKQEECCAACGIHRSLSKLEKRLEGHAIFRIDYADLRVEYLKTVLLCPACHSYIHKGVLQALVQKGQKDGLRLALVLDHGNNIIMENHLEDKLSEIEEKMEKEVRIAINKGFKWNDWRMIIENKILKPRFKSFKSWFIHYNSEEAWKDYEKKKQREQRFKRPVMDYVEGKVCDPFGPYDNRFIDGNDSVDESRAFSDLDKEPGENNGGSLFNNLSYYLRPF
jgi:hypothetical protein